VTTAAQFGVVPLSLYYFHQFPGLFFMTNLVILPFLAIILGLGIFVILLTIFNELPDWLASSYNYLIKQLNHFISWVSQQESLLFENISFSLANMIMSYLIITSIILIWKKTTPNRLMQSLVCIALFLGVKTYENTQLKEERLLLFHKSRKTLIAQQKDKTLTLFSSDSLIDYRTFPTKNYSIQNNISSFSSEIAPHLFSFKNKTILRIDSLGVYPKTNIDIVLLSYSPKMHLQRLIDTLQPKLIIADGSNYTSYVKRWEHTCRENGIPFHNTKTDGYYEFK
jgi:competence protein ComEC